MIGAQGLSALYGKPDTIIDPPRSARTDRVPIPEALEPPLGHSHRRGCPSGCSGQMPSQPNLVWKEVKLHCSRLPTFNSKLRRQRRLPRAVTPVFGSLPCTGQARSHRRGGSVTPAGALAADGPQLTRGRLAEWPGAATLVRQLQLPFSRCHVPAVRGSGARRDAGLLSPGPRSMLRTRRQPSADFPSSLSDGRGQAALRSTVGCSTVQDQRHHLPSFLTRRH